MFRVVIHVEVGSDMIEIRVNGKPVTIREVGSAMASRWGKYLPDCDCLMVNLLPFQKLLFPNCV
jgi:hypothetical protein